MKRLFPSVCPYWSRAHNKNRPPVLALYIAFGCCLYCPVLHDIQLHCCPLFRQNVPRQIFLVCHQYRDAGGSYHRFKALWSAFFQQAIGLFHALELGVYN